MKATNLLILTIAISLNAVFAQDNADFRDLEGPYLGQNPPGLSPEPFAPGIVSTEEYFEDYGVFTPDMKEFYFRRYGGKYEKRTLFVIRYDNQTWGKETVVPIGRGPSFFSEDGNIMYSGNKYLERTNAGWSERKSLGAPFEDLRIMGISASSKGTYFFDELDTIGAISYSRLVNGKYEKPQKLGKEINTGTWIAHPFIAPDESYLMWDAQREGGYGENDLYISFRQKDGSWGAAINMGERINTAFQESSARVTPDGKYFFFWRGNEKAREDGSTYWVGSIHWVDAQVIKNLKSLQ